MEIIRDLEALARHPYPVTAIGNFDGVHLGHRAILKAAIDRARAAGGTAFALTFDPLPAKLLFPARAPKLILTPEDKLELLRLSGIDGVIVINFTLDLSMLPPRDFVREYLRGKIGVREVVVGHSVSFGHNRAGNANVMVELGRELGFDTDVVGPVKVDGIEVSSTKVREAITTGDLHLAIQATRPSSLPGRPGSARTRARTHDRISNREPRQRNRMHPARRRLRHASSPRRRQLPVDHQRRDAPNLRRERPLDRGAHLRLHPRHLRKKNQGRTGRTNPPREKIRQRRRSESPNRRRLKKSPRNPLRVAIPFCLLSLLGRG